MWSMNLKYKYNKLCTYREKELNMQSIQNKKDFLNYYYYETNVCISFFEWLLKNMQTPIIPKP